LVEEIRRIVLERIELTHKLYGTKVFEFSEATGVGYLQQSISQYLQSFECAVADEFVVNESVTGGKGYQFYNREHLLSFVANVWNILHVRNAKENWKKSVENVFKSLTDEQLEKTLLFMLSIKGGENV
jgi:hypothetical protein